MIDPIQPQIATAPKPSSSDPARLSTASSASAPPPAASTDDDALANVNKGAAPAGSDTPARAAQAAGSGGTSDAQSTSDAAQPLRLLIEHDKTTNHYVYKLYDSSGRIVREIPQESLAEAQKQSSGSAGVVIDTKV